MLKQVLDVGQCGVDHAAISQFLLRNFEVEVSRANGATDTLSTLRKQRFDLVLINRKLDADGSDGLDILKQIKGDAALADVPVMLVSNYSDQQELAIAVGAAPGFGKSALNAAQTVERVRQILG